MSLVLLIVVLLSSQVRVAFAVVGSQNEKVLSRQAALLGLSVAVGRLQSEAGSDRVATANRSLIEGDDANSGHSRWVGVWNIEDQVPEVSWLVSGLPESESEVDSIVLLSEDQVTNPEDSVSVGMETLTDSGGQQFRVGYWISEENTKAALDGSSLAWDPASYYGDERDEVFSEMPGMSLVSGFDPSSTIQSMNGGSSFSLEGSLPSVGRATSLQDYTFGVGVPSDFAREHFHNFTTRSFSVLSNPLDGGLKKDLSFLKTLASDGDFTSTQLRNLLELDEPYVTSDWIDFISFHRIGSLSDPLNPDFNLTSAVDEEVRFVAHPLMPELAIACGIGCRSTTSGVTGDVYIYFYIFADFLNPFPFEMDLDNGTGSWPGDPTDFDIRVINLPEIEIENVTEGIVTTLQLPDIEGGVNTFYNHEPGYMRPVSHPTGSYRSDISGNTGVGVIAVPVGNLGYQPDTWDEFRVQFPAVEEDEDPVTIQVLSGSSEGFTGSGTLVKEIQLQNWGDFEIFYPATNNNNRFVRGGTAMDRGHLSSGDFTWGFHVRYVDDWIEGLAGGSLQNLDYFFSEFDPRRRLMVIDMDDRFSGDGEFIDVADPDDLQRSNFMRQDEFFLSSWFGSDSGNRDIRVFDMPFFEPVSVGQLNEMVFEGRARKPIGGYFNGEPKGEISDENGDGDTFDSGESLSNLYDQFFFSTIPSDATDWENIVDQLANHRLRLYNSESDVDVVSLNSAENLLLEWGFNVNSTSVEAWSALLESTGLENLVSSLEDQPAFFSQLPNFSGEGGFFPSRSFSPTISLDPNDYVNESQTSNWVTDLRLNANHPAFMQGFRQIEMESIRALAEEIVREIKEYVEDKGDGSPIGSITEFADSGILERAILAESSLNQSGSNRVPFGSLGRVDQEIILRKIAPTLVARSDTFRVHVYGELLETVTNQSSHQRLVAEMQRVPDELDRFGRKFRLIDFKWVE